MYTLEVAAKQMDAISELRSELKKEKEKTENVMRILEQNYKASLRSIGVSNFLLPSFWQEFKEIHQIENY